MRVRTCLGGIAGALLLAGTAGAQDKIEIRFGTTNPPGGMQYLSGEEWVKRVNEKAGDLVQADIYGSSQLGDDTEMLQKVRLGTLEVSQRSTIMSTVLPEFSLFDMPYLVKDRAHMDCIAKLAWPSSPGAQAWPGNPIRGRRLRGGCLDQVPARQNTYLVTAGCPD
jgi:TRAP-type transport system periplasmic protein